MSEQQHPLRFQGMRTSSPPESPQDVACPGLAALLARLAATDSEQDWAELISRHGRFIRQACRSQLASESWIDDAVQE